MNVNHDLDEMRDRLRDGEVEMVYLKKDGSIRIAHGTLCASLIPIDQRPKGKRTSSVRVLCYYDLDKDVWRCLLRTNLMGFVEKE